MRFLLSITALATLSLSPASAEEEPTELEAAGMQVALAASCRATYGENELFEVAFTRMEGIAHKSGVEVSRREMMKFKEELYDIEPGDEDNMFLRGFCTKLKEHLMH